MLCLVIRISSPNIAAHSARRGNVAHDLGKPYDFMQIGTTDL